MGAAGWHVLMCEGARAVPQKVYTVKGSSRQKRLWGGIADLGGAGIPRCARNDNLKARAVSGYGNQGVLQVKSSGRVMRKAAKFLG